MTTAFLNGSFVPLEQARIPVLDRGFLFGDGVYEVIPVYGRHLFRLPQHLKRLHNNLLAVSIPEPMTAHDWGNMLAELVRHNAGEDQSVYLQVTRGVAPRRDHAFGKDLQPTVFAMSTPLEASDPAVTEKGIAAVTLSDIRWQHCHIKAITLLPNVLLRQQAIEAGASEAILVRDGFATEGAASNLFVVSNGLLLTPPTGPLLLPGITRDLLLELAVANALPFREVDIPDEQLRTADEIWLTSSTREIMPVTSLDDEPVGTGKPGPLFQRMRDLYLAYKHRVRAGEAA
jgi:D-alanine transaminase